MHPGTVFGKRNDIVSEMVQDRVLPLTGIHNFRDYGDYAARDGRLRRGWLYRSAQHRDATSEDLARVDALGLRTVIDLRGESERRASPCPRGPGFAARLVLVPEETAGLAPHIEAAGSITSAEGARAAMRANYAGMPFRPMLLQLLQRYFEALESAEGPSLIHCVAGKDRTGLAVALLQAMMGVHPDDVMADYLLTNSAGNVEARIAAGAKAIRANYGKQMPDEAIQALMSVERSYLDAALAAIEAADGSIEAYLANRAGVTAERRDRIAQAVID
jgi:protein-tyrosine phosphatase